MRPMLIGLFRHLQPPHLEVGPSKDGLATHQPHLRPIVSRLQEEKEKSYLSCPDICPVEDRPHPQEEVREGRVGVTLCLSHHAKTEPQKCQKYQLRYWGRVDIENATLSLSVLLHFKAINGCMNYKKNRFIHTKVVLQSKTLKALFSATKLRE